ncbi:MAG: transketolase, partial [Deltaproteobacteria bacterium]|nr:transketolase [Deltaproteobacteria bacterium]
TLRRINSSIQGHPDRAALPVVEASTGSLGQGLSIAQGIALGLKLKKSPARVYCMMGDGEIQEGQVWETIMSGPKFKLGNLVAIVDCNNGQIDGHVTEVMDLAPLADKWRAFRWHVQEVNGHSIEEILIALDKTATPTDQPHAIIARTVKGKGVSFMENNIGWHGMAPNPEETARALEELRQR